MEVSVSLGGLEISEVTRFSIGLIPYLVPWRCWTDETTVSSSSPAQGAASKYSKHDLMHVPKPSNSAA